MQTVKHWRLPLLQALLAGSLGSVLSTVALAAAGRRQAGSAAAPLNAISHWYWKDEALHRQETDLTHTAAGYLTHHGVSIFWAAVHAALAHRRPALRTGAGVVAGAIATSAAACFADFRLAPHRFTPGYEHRLSRSALLAVYAAFAVGLGAGALALRGRYRDGQDPDRGSAPGQAAAAPKPAASHK